MASREVVVVIGHVEMTQEQYARISPAQRGEMWSLLIRKAGFEGKAFLPIPYRDKSRMVVGMNLVGLPGESERG